MTKLFSETKFKLNSGFARSLILWTTGPLITMTAFLAFKTWRMKHTTGKSRPKVSTSTNSSLELSIDPSIAKQHRLLIPRVIDQSITKTTSFWKLKWFWMAELNGQGSPFQQRKPWTWKNQISIKIVLRNTLEYDWALPLIMACSFQCRILFICSFVFRSSSIRAAICLYLILQGHSDRSPSIYWSSKSLSKSQSYIFQTIRLQMNIVLITRLRSDL